MIEDPSAQDLKRLIAFTGLKIVRIDIGDNDITLVLRFRRKFFTMNIKDQVVTLYDNQHNLLATVEPKNKPITNIPWQPASSPTVQPYYPIISTGTIGDPNYSPQWTYTTYCTSNSTDAEFINNMNKVLEKNPWST